MSANSWSTTAPRPTNGGFSPGRATLVAMLVIALPLPCWGASRPTNRDPRVESFVTESVNTLNARIEAAAVAGDAWVKDPVRIALTFVERGKDVLDERRYLQLTFEGEGGGWPTAATVTVVADGYLDDSVGGEWFRFRLARRDDRTWRLSGLDHAWRCVRGHHLTKYSKVTCP